MQETVSEFLSQLNDTLVYKFPPLRYLIKFDVMDLFNFSSGLGDFLLSEPLKFSIICNDIFYACLKSSDNHLKEFIQPSQVAVTIRLKSLPRILSRPSTHRYENIVTFNGLLLTVSKLTSNVFHTVWSCPEECEGNEVILHYIPKSPPKCQICKSVMFENSGLRQCGEQVTATFKLKSELLSKKFVVTDDLIPLLKLGSVYLIHTIALKKTVAVWSIEEVVNFPAPVTYCSPKDIRDLYNSCGGVPWKFIYCLASSIGVNICPLNCFINVKMNLLLSLTSVKAHAYDGSTIVHYFSVGSDTGYIGKLMSEGALLADRHVALGVANSSVETALTASSSGVCLLPLPLHVYSPKQINSLLTAIETWEVVQDSGKSDLKCAVWAQGTEFKKDNLGNISSILGVLSRGDIGEETDELADFVLQQAIEPPQATDEEVKALRDLAEYIDIVAGLSVTISDDAENLLRNYFLAARKERPNAISVAGMGALVAICMTSARLCRRITTSIEDAIFSIWLHAAGLPEPRFAPDEYLQMVDVKKTQKIIDLFVPWLEQFTGTAILQT
ncbi:unnamed protein product [Leptosia nina]|uniref:MCMDC2 N-terminal domain-containing protein n=1 Tax=Leptosia nina TaxID=320188 RepID=A0AAV1J1F2_9NEOP